MKTPGMIHMKLTDILMDSLPDGHPWDGNVKGLVDRLIENGVSVQKWISVKKMFPKHKQVVLAYVDPCVEIVQWNEADELWEADAGWFKLDSVTHWMPLPEPPEEGE